MRVLSILAFRSFCCSSQALWLWGPPYFTSVKPSDVLPMFFSSSWAPGEFCSRTHVGGPIKACHPNDDSCEGGNRQEDLKCWDEITAGAERWGPDLCWWLGGDYTTVVQPWFSSNRCQTSNKQMMIFIFKTYFCMSNNSVGFSPHQHEIKRMWSTYSCLISNKVIIYYRGLLVLLDPIFVSLLRFPHNTFTRGAIKVLFIDYW